MNARYEMGSARTTIKTLCFLLFALSTLTCAQRVRSGAEMLIEKHLSLLAAKRVGIICNHTSLLPNGTHIVDTLLRLGVKVTALFGPEHGIRGIVAAGEDVDDSIDRTTGLPVYSLYGKTHKPTPEMLQAVDVLVFDIQDVGARFYTYPSTMAYAMEAAAENHKAMIVLDRPNPIDGLDTEGPLLDTAFRSFVGLFPIPVRHGLTLCELAKMIRGERWLGEHVGVDLTVISMEGWKRNMWYDDTGLPWVAPSPNMKTLATATVYPGTCLFEGTNVSEGRGTEKPFEYIGAPWINGDSIVARLVRFNLPGVEFKSVRFTPKADPIKSLHPKYENVSCNGILLNVIDRKKFRPFWTVYTLLTEIRRLYPDSLKFKVESFDRLAGTSGVREALHNDLTSNGLSRAEKKDIDRYREMRKKYLLY